MRDNPSRFRPITALIITAILAGCSSQPTQQVIQQPLPGVETTPRTADQLLVQAERATFPENAKLKIQAAKKLMSDQPYRAQTVLESLQYDNLPSELQANLSLIRAEIAEHNGQNWEVFHWLDRKPVINSSDPNLVNRSHILRAKAFNRYGEYLAALDEWLSAIPNLHTDQQEALYQGFWTTLLHVPHDRLMALNSQTRDTSLKGWLELAMIYSPGKALDQQLENLNQWRSQWSDHPASQFLPANLDTLSPEAVSRPQKIALLLPTSGPLATAGKSVRDGFMAAYYFAIADHSGSDSQHTPEVLFFDTYKADIPELAEKARDEGAELIIGPLDKGNVIRLKQSPPEGLTILALNYVDSNYADISQPNGTGGLGFYQFGLSTEDEAKLAAQRGILDGHRRALIFTSNASWSQRAVESFTAEWKKLNGEVAGISQFDKQSEYSTLAGEALLVDKSQQRARQISRLLREQIGFEPRRRQDVDMIFMATSPEEARQIKPAIAYQYAGDIPTYATSNAYSGQTSRSRDQDLNFLRIPVMPWYIPGQSSPLKLSITDTWSTARGQYGSLFALGADSYNLHPRLQQLRSLSGSRIDALTGWLSINEQGRVSRELPWQIFRNGQLTPLPIPVQNTDVLAAQTSE
ncbi:penicillin-binding protein activator [Endozoicomonas gorgoniicola]|uniref:Penicillin-binding protein activator n=1 Tax=Endozoicomonas gorgoniicola TaxID=1234144 RepID=A0ABT3MW24_9GAMM|nr:penicillin-binding protein activator [Endozoicomonas gorgoniicola]MCW7553584.1 penicillin-binding protein activator [Endozoicomonas gorgoniicola]